MKKIIGITTSLNKTQNIINNAYIRAFSTENTIPLLIPNIFEPKNEIITIDDKIKLSNDLEEITKHLDAIILSGGTDINPITIGEKLKDSSAFNYNRDYVEKELIQICIRKKIPILGICRGFQMLGTYLKLNYFQQDISITKEKHNGSNSDIYNRKEPMHDIIIFGKFKQFCEKQNIAETRILVNSWHEQGFTLTEKGDRILNKDLEDFVTQKVDFKDPINKKVINNLPGINIIMSTNYVIEGFEHKILPIVAFQFHPEEYTNSIAINYFLDKYVTKEYNETEKEKTT